MNIRYFILFLCIIKTCKTNAQIFAIENTRLNYAYPNIENKLKIIAENEKCESIFLKTDNGKIMNSYDLGNRCQYTFIPDSIGLATLTIYKVKHFDTIKVGEQKYRIKKWPELRVMIGNIESGCMTRGIFLAQRGIIVPIDFNDIQGRIKVNSYKIEVLRNNKLFLQLINFGDHFEKQNYDKLEAIKNGDIIIFSEIKLRMPGEPNETKLKEIKIEIKNSP